MMASRVQRLFSTLRTLRHDNPLVSKTPIFFIPHALTGFTVGTYEAWRSPAMPRRSLPPKRGIPNVKKVIAVASGKGGVGKSTIAGLSVIHSTYGIRHGALFTSKRTSPSP
jgi:hypothetical protein